MFLKKLLRGYIWKRIFFERLTEPLHLNLLSFWVMVFGSFRAKVEFDLVLRCQHAYSLLKAADRAKGLGLESVTVIEFGVAAGAGLMNLAKVAAKVTRLTGVEIRICGFDTGLGMPPPQSYRDHPDLYQEGDFKMDVAALRAALPANCHLVIGEVETTVPRFLEELSDASPLGFISIDVDYYYSTKQALRILSGPPSKYLPKVAVYLDDLEDESHNSYCGELLAVREFTDSHEFRKIEKHAFLRSYRIFRNARWIDHIFTAHILDHPTRSTLRQSRQSVTLSNPYL